MSSSNSSVEPATTGASIAISALHRPHFGWSLARDAGTRFLEPHAGQDTIMGPPVARPRRSDR